MRLRPLLFAVSFLVLFAACESDTSTEEPASEPSTATTAPTAESTTTYTAEGTVRSVNPSGSHVVIQHERIPGFMDAMTMPFQVADTVSVNHLETDDRIRFTFAAGAGGTTIQSVERVDDP